jgi:hypothetical protein
VGSLTKCIAKMGKLLDPADVAALTAFDGSAADAVDARIAEIRAEMDEIRAMAGAKRGAAPRSSVAPKEPDSFRNYDEDGEFANLADKTLDVVGAADAKSVAPLLSTAPKSTAPDQTQTAAFRRWFGDSKVVDAQGRPLVVYHGTAEDFDTFSERAHRSVLNRKYQGDGFHFSDDPGIASSYADAARNQFLNKAKAYAAVDASVPPLTRGHVQGGGGGWLQHRMGHSRRGCSGRH